MGLNTTPATWTTSEVVTAAKMNTEVRDALTGVPSIPGVTIAPVTSLDEYRVRRAAFHVPATPTEVGPRAPRVGVFL